MSMRTIDFDQRVREKALDYSRGSVELRLREQLSFSVLAAVSPDKQGR